MKIPSYYEIMCRKLPPDFNWLAVLKDLADGAPLTVDEHSRLCSMSGQWPTCACGQLCQSLERDYMGRPLDLKAAQLGGEFSGYIVLMKWSQAIQTFHKIEARTMELLHEQGRD